MTAKSVYRTKLLCLMDFATRIKDTGSENITHMATVETLKQFLDTVIIPAVYWQ